MENQVGEMLISYINLGKRLLTLYMHGDYLFHAKSWKHFDDFEFIMVLNDNSFGFCNFLLSSISWMHYGYRFDL